MAHFATRSRLGFAVEVEFRARLGRDGWHLVHIIADEICHLDIGMTGRVNKRPTRDSADVLLELVDDGPGFGWLR